MSSSTSISSNRTGTRRGGLRSWLVGACCGLAGVLVLIVVLVLALVDGETILVYKRDMLEWKLARLTPPGRPRHVIVVSGSNTLYSVNSPVLERELGWPVTNFGQHWGVALYAAERLAAVLRPGDVVLAPLEYETYLPGGDRSAIEPCFLIAHDRSRIKRLRDWVQVFATCNPVLLAGGVAIKLAAGVGLGYPRIDMGGILNAHGDALDNEPSRGRAQLGLAAPIIGDLGDAPLSLPRLERIIARWRERGATVLLSFPVLPRGQQGVAPVSRNWLRKFRVWVRRQGAHVVSTPEAHLFPRDCFFDSAYHLHRGCTADNARIYAAAVRPFLR